MTKYATAGEATARRTSAAADNRAGLAAMSSNNESITATEPTPKPPNNAPPIMCQPLVPPLIESVPECDAARCSTAIVMAIG